MKILYLDGVGPFGGASRSLFETVRALSQFDVKPHFVVARGTALNFYLTVADDAIATRGLTRFDNTNYSHYQGFRWLVLLREIFHFPYTLLALSKARRKWKSIELIHVNEVTEIIPGLIAKRFFKVPLVVHVRSPQWMDVRSLRTQWVNKMLKKHASAVIAINETTRATLPQDLAVDVIQNSFTPKRSENPDHKLVDKLARLRPKALKVGFVGNLHISKGVFDLLEAASLLRAAKHDVEFVIVGGYTRVDKGIKGWLLKQAGLAENLHEELVKRIQDYGVEDCFHLMGATDDIQCVYECIDLIAFPSHYDAPGRPVFEAAFSSVPCITCVNDPKPDTVIPNETGVVVPARNPQALAEAIGYLESNRAEIVRMGQKAKQLADENFNPLRNAEKLNAVYRRVLNN